MILERLCKAINEEETVLLLNCNDNRGVGKSTVIRNAFMSRPNSLLIVNNSREVEKAKSICRSNNIISTDYISQIRGVNYDYVYIDVTGYEENYPILVDIIRVQFPTVKAITGVYSIIEKKKEII